jgi:hypothetical protein
MEKVIRPLATSGSYDFLTGGVLVALVVAAGDQPFVGMLASTHKIARLS